MVECFHGCSLQRQQLLSVGYNDWFLLSQDVEFYSLHGVKANNVQYLKSVTNHNSIASGAGMGKCTTEIKFRAGCGKNVNYSRSLPAKNVWTQEWEKSVNPTRRCWASAESCAAWAWAALGARRVLLRSINESWLLLQVLQSSVKTKTRCTKEEKSKQIWLEIN